MKTARLTDGRASARRCVSAGVLCLGLAALGGCGGEDSPVQPTANHPPVLQSQADTAGVRGDTLRLVAAATDPDGDAVSLDFAVIVTLHELQDGYRCHAGINRATGQFWFVPESLDVPSRGFRFMASDGRGGADTTSFQVRSQ